MADRREAAGDLGGGHGPAGSLRRSLPSPLPGRRRPGRPEPGKPCACAAPQTRSPAAAAGSLTFRSRCIFPSGVTPIFRVSLTGPSTPPFRRLSGLPLFFFLSLYCRRPLTFHARACQDRTGPRLSAARPVPGHPRELGLAVLLLPRPARAAARARERVGGRCRWALLGSLAWTPEEEYMFTFSEQEHVPKLHFGSSTLHPKPPTA